MDAYHWPQDHRRSSCSRERSVAARRRSRHRLATPLAERIERRIVCLEMPPSDIARYWGVLRRGDPRRASREGVHAEQRPNAKQPWGSGPDHRRRRRPGYAGARRCKRTTRIVPGSTSCSSKIDLVARERVPLAVLLITNRAAALDPAIVRRAALHLRFERPTPRGAAARSSTCCSGDEAPDEATSGWLRCRERALAGSLQLLQDLTVRLAQAAMRRAWSSDSGVQRLDPERDAPRVHRASLRRLNRHKSPEPQI